MRKQGHLGGARRAACLIANTTTSVGLRIKAAVDARRHEKALEVSDEDLAKVRIKPHRFHGECSYTIRAMAP
jgi:hypothetical protein